MKLSFVALFAAGMIAVASPVSAVAQQFPRLQEENLNGQQVVLPATP